MNTTGVTHRMVAVCDILGFSDLVEKHPLDAVVNNALGNFRRALHFAIHKKHFPDAVPSRNETNSHALVGVAWFSDTFLLYAKSDDDDAVKELLATLSWLIFSSMSFGPRIRGRRLRRGMDRRRELRLRW